MDEEVVEEKEEEVEEEAGRGETRQRRVIDPEKGSNEQLDGRAGPVQRAARPVLQHQGVDPKFLRFLRHSTAPTRPLPPLFLAY